jgi:hypothetical protein
MPVAASSALSRQNPTYARTTASSPLRHDSPASACDATMTTRHVEHHQHPGPERSHGRRPESTRR